MSRDAWWFPIRRFSEHALVVCVFFAVIALPTVLLSALIRLGAAMGMTPFTVTVLKILEGAALLIDASMVLIYVAWRAWKLLRVLTHE